MGNYLVRFLGGNGGESPPLYPERRVLVDCNYANATIGHLLDAEQNGASKFPNEIRYGQALMHFPVSVMAKLSNKTVAWVQLHWDDIQA